MKKIIDNSEPAEQFKQLKNYKDFLFFLGDFLLLLTKETEETEKKLNININSIYELSEIPITTEEIKMQDYISKYTNDDDKIGLCIAGNAGKPAGGLSINYTINDITKNPIGQEENILYDWFYMEHFNHNKELINYLFVKTIKGRWGLEKPKDITSTATIQKIDYSRLEEKTIDYFLVYSVKTMYQNKNNVYLLFTFSPNTQENSKTGSMARTKDLAINENTTGLSLYIKGLIAALSATILCAIKKKINILLLPYVGCNINAYYSHKSYLIANFKKFVIIASNIIYKILKDKNISLQIIICKYIKSSTHD